MAIKNPILLKLRDRKFYKLPLPNEEKQPGGSK